MGTFKFVFFSRLFWVFFYLVVLVLYHYLYSAPLIQQIEADVNLIILRLELVMNANETLLNNSSNVLVSITNDSSSFNVLLTTGGFVLVLVAGFFLFGIVLNLCYSQPIFLPYESWLSFHLKANSAYSIYSKWLPIYSWKAQSLKYYRDYYIQIWATHDNPAADQLPEVIITLGEKYQQMLDFQHCGYKVLQYMCASDPGAINRLTPKDLDLFFKTLEHSRDITDFILVSKKVANADAFGVINKLFT